MAALGLGAIIFFNITVVVPTHHVNTMLVVYQYRNPSGTRVVPQAQVPFYSRISFQYTSGTPAVRASATVLSLVPDIRVIYWY